MNFESVGAFLAELQAGDSVFIGGSSAEPRPLVGAISDAAPDLPPLEIVHSFVPGINPVALAAPGNQLSETAIFPRKHYGSKGSTAGLVPASYYGYNQYLAQRDFDWDILQVSPPDERGRCCLGPSVEFLPAVMRRSKKLVGIVNPQVPRIPGSGFVTLEQLTHTCLSDAGLVNYDAGSADEVSEKISANVASLIDDRSTLQLGLGKVPALLLDALTDRKNLQFHTGLLTEGFFTLVDAGAINLEARHSTCVCLGSDDFYQHLADSNLVHVTGVEFTHAPSTLAALDALIAVNSALEVDLGGQVNLEFRNGRQVSSAGGAPDFARAASLSANGKSIIALPATAAKGSVSRIVQTLRKNQPVSLTPCDIDYVVTEFGIAHLAGRSIAEAAQALIAVAAPDFREELAKSMSS